MLVVADEAPVTQGYMLVHLRQMFEDVEVYGWKSVHEYYSVWLQLLEQGRAA